MSERLFFCITRKAGAIVDVITGLQCAVKRRWSTAGRKTRPGTGSLPPVAIGAVVEATKPLKPPVERVALGDSASLQVVTRVNAEQASKLIMQEPPHRYLGKAEVNGPLMS